MNNDNEVYQYMYIFIYRAIFVPVPPTQQLEWFLLFPKTHPDCTCVR